jgi:hypothetical protein
MGVQNSEVGYTTAMPRKEDHEVHKDMWWHLIKNILFCEIFGQYGIRYYICNIYDIYNMM